VAVIAAGISPVLIIPLRKTVGKPEVVEFVPINPKLGTDIPERPPELITLNAVNPEKADTAERPPVLIMPKATVPALSSTLAVLAAVAVARMLLPAAVVKAAVDATLLNMMLDGEAVQTVAAVEVEAVYTDAAIVPEFDMAAPDVLPVKIEPSVAPAAP